MLACYVYLLKLQPAESIILAGDSAGAGMVLAILCLLRDQGQQLPAGAVLISPWVDLCHSFPSVAADSDRGGSDYLPAHGFLHRPSEAWPPLLPTARTGARTGPVTHSAADPGAGADPAAGPATDPVTDPAADPAKDSATEPGADPERLRRRRHRRRLHRPAPCPRVTIDGHEVELHDQIQLYTTNDMLTHPLVSPVNQRSLAGLCPLLVLSGGGELLRDEQVYMAHKAAFPHAFGAPDDLRPPTRVWLQVFARACHVVPTLAWTRPAKMVGATIAAFGRQVWSSSPPPSSASAPAPAPTPNDDQLAGFRFEVVSLSRGSRLRPPLTPQDFPPRERIGVIAPEPVRRWLEAKARWDAKYASVANRLHQQQLRLLQDLGREGEGGDGGCGGGGDGEEGSEVGDAEEGEEEVEYVPPSAAYRRWHQKCGPEQPTANGDPEEAESQAPREKGWGMSLWAGWSAKSDRNMARRSG